MFHIHAAMTAPYDEKELGFDEELTRSMEPIMKRRGRAPSDDLSTAAPSPEASPAFGPQLPDDSPLLLESDIFHLPDAQESYSGSEGEFELSGCGGAESCDEFELLGLDDAAECFSDTGGSSDSLEDTESELLDLLSELAALRAESRRQLGDELSASGLQKIPYPQLESGFIPSHFMPGSQSWLVPAGRAETGQWAYAMAPRPANFDGMQPLNIVLGASGVSLEVGTEMPEEYRGECERRRLAEAKAVFRRRRGRSRSPLVSMEDMLPKGVPEGSPRGRPRFWTR